jgi:hypothetical protein
MKLIKTTVLTINKQVAMIVHVTSRTVMKYRNGSVLLGVQNYVVFFPNCTAVTQDRPGCTITGVISGRPTLFDCTSSLLYYFEK